jgi:dolichol-phosphate mannosyltransferase
MTAPAYPFDLSIVIPALNEAENLAELLPQVHQELSRMGVRYQITIVDERPDEATLAVIEQNQVNLLSPNTRGYGSALLAGLRHAQGEYVVSMDADFSHPPDFLHDLWAQRNTANIIIASRYVKGGKAIMPLSRLLLSRVLNNFFSLGLGLHIHDMSSGYRLYQTRALSRLSIESSNFEVLQELLVRAIVEGYTVSEIPFTYRPRVRGSSHARVIKFGIAYLKTFARLKQLRNSNCK